ncbi:MAG: hypothetical protein DHS20C16_14030 [Phycisphaerae bacterium]|nr:MAG: hypothetical protein DHS20C16_14030 [Phycisphaerae bacterium]
MAAFMVLDSLFAVVYPVALTRSLKCNRLVYRPRCTDFLLVSQFAHPTLDATVNIVIASYRV